MISNTIHRQLSVLSDELAALSEERAILAERLVVARDAADQTRLRALVAETPLADRDQRIAGDEVRRIERLLAQVTDRAARLDAERERLLEQARGGRGAA